MTSRRPFRIALIVVVSTVVLLLAIGGWFLHGALAYPDEAHAGKGGVVEIEIKEGMSVSQVATLLANKGVIGKPTYFRLWVMWRGDTGRIKSGSYQIEDNKTPRFVLQKLLEGVKEKTVDVDLPPGGTMLDFFALLEKHGVAKASELLVVARDPEFLRSRAIPGDSVEGYLYPAKYNFRVNDKPRKVLERLVRVYQERWNELVRTESTKLQKVKDRLKWSDHDVLVMASIVEREAVDPAEQPRIAQVFINRLTDPSFTPKKLQTDPTIRYGCIVPAKKSAACEQWLKTCEHPPPPDPPKCPRLRTAQLEDKDNPYNTYAIEKLPPGPIGNPGIGAIKAVLAPDGSNYFYFVAIDERTHAFARTRAEHERNVDKYQR